MDSNNGEDLLHFPRSAEGLYPCAGFGGLAFLN
jgi:hypothetical protein